MISFIDAAINLSAALVLGGMVGFERQYRQRLAGLRTNTLVALGSAMFVVFASLYPDEVSPTRVAAQVVSGIGFLGAGVIFKEGLNVRGLNTAATLWCSAAVGVLAGSGHIAHAALATVLIIVVNLLLRPLIHKINKQPIEQSELQQGYAIDVVCRSAQEAHIRALLLQGLASQGLHLRALESSNIEETDRVTVKAVIAAEGKVNAAIEQIVGRLSLEPSVTGAGWHSETLSD